MKQLGFALLTIIVYTVLFHSLGVAILLVGAIAFHEYSHLLAAQKMGLPTRGFFLLPFVGGVALVAGRYRRYSQQAFVVLAGPVGGGLLALVTAGAYLLLGFPWLAAAAYWMCFLNLFNLAPLSFLDGGQLMGTITYSINRTLGVVCVAVSTVIAVLVILHFNPVLGLMIAWFGGSAAWKEIQNLKAWNNGQTYLCPDTWINPPKKLSILQMSGTILGWGFTAAVLAFTMSILTTLEPAAANLRYFFQ